MCVCGEPIDSLQSRALFYRSKDGGATNEGLRQGPVVVIERNRKKEEGGERNQGEGGRGGRMTVPGRSVSLGGAGGSEKKSRRVTEREGSGRERGQREKTGGQE